MTLPMAVRAGRNLLCGRTERLDALVVGKLAGDVNPRRLTSLAAVPCVSDKYPNLGGWNIAETSVGQELRHTGVALQLVAGFR